MIEFNEKDFQLGRIRRESKLSNLQTKNPFRVYGLTTKENPLIHVSYNYDLIIENFDENMKNLKAFFKQNKIEFQVESGGGTPKVCIGLRRDLRDHVVLCCAILQMIVYALEDRLDLNANYCIDGVPVFPNSKGVIKPQYRVVAEED